MQKFKLVFFTDDDHDDLEIMKEITEELGHDAEIFTCGEAMFNQLEQTLTPDNPHIIFLDISMPKVDGFEVIGKIRALAEYDEIPIVVHSGRCDDKCLDDAYELGANYYMKKELSYNGVKASIVTAIETDWKSFKPKREEFLHIHKLN